MKRIPTGRHLCGLVPLLALAMILSAPVIGGAVPLETAPCADCHAEICDSFQMTYHGAVLTPASLTNGNVCESCHGNGAAHAESGDPGLIVNPAKTSPFDDTEPCLTCHKGPSFDEWPFAQHRGADVGCAACHRVHAAGKDAGRPQTPGLCYTCHAGVRAEVMMPSHHPVIEGKVGCLDCHNPHGGAARLTADNTGRDLCFLCHADKEGPFIYEHAPVNEDCLVCHRPHGTVADNLLKQNEPALCLSCHAMHFHATVEGVDGEFTVPLDASRNGVSTPDGWKVGMLTKCTQCHSAIHGTDLPSQALSTGGNALTR